MENDIKIDTKRAINHLCELLTRDCGGTDWELAMLDGNIYLSGGWQDNAIEIDTNLPLVLPEA